MSDKPEIDEVDVKILRALEKNARINFADIAKNCEVSKDTISKRFQKMKKENVIRGTTLLLNPKNLGYECLASLDIDGDFSHVKEIVEHVRKIPEIVFCSTCMGRYNIFCIAVLKNIGRLSQVKDMIKGHPLVKDVSTSIWVDEILLCPENFEFETKTRR